MKKIIFMLMAGFLVFVLAACGSTNEPANADPEPVPEPVPGISLLSATEAISEEWATSGKTFAIVSTDGRGIGCAKCHDGYAFANFKKYDGTQDFGPPHMTGIDCAACHTGFGAELLGIGEVNVPFMADSIKAGKASACFFCHNGNRNPSDLFAQSSAGELSRLTYPHYGMNAALLTGKGGMEIPGVSYASSGAHANIPDSCVACHMPVTDEGYIQHTFAMDINHIDQVCGDCHGGITSWNLNGFQDDIKAMLDKVYAAILEATSAAEIDAGGGAFIFRDADGETMDIGSISHEAYVATYNWRIIYKDGSYGVHNPRYAKSLLQESYKLLTGNNL